jgi:murein endopeptidase
VIRAALTGTLAALAIAAPAAAQCRSQAIGTPQHGRLKCGVQLPVATDDLTTWDNALQRPFNRPWRRWGTDRLIARVEQLAAEYHAHFGTRIVVGDLSRTNGGIFDQRYGGSGHNSHQNGLDADIYYPRRDRLELPPFAVADVDRIRAQWLVDRAAKRAHFVFIGPHVGLHRTNRHVQYLVAHDNHLHLRIPNGKGG